MQKTWIHCVKETFSSASSTGVAGCPVTMTWSTARASALAGAPEWLSAATPEVRLKEAAPHTDSPTQAFSSAHPSEPGAYLSWCRCHLPRLGPRAERCGSTSPGYTKDVRRAFRALRAPPPAQHGLWLGTLPSHLGCGQHLCAHTSLSRVSTLGACAPSAVVLSGPAPRISLPPPNKTSWDANTP